MLNGGKVVFVRTVLAATFLACTSAACAEEPAKRVQVASLTFTSGCKNFDFYADTRDQVSGGGLNEPIGPSLGAALLPSFSGLLGDVVGAGLNAVSDALKQASRAQAFSVEGRTVYPFYILRVPEHDSAPVLETKPAEGCLVLQMRSPPPADEDMLQPEGTGYEPGDRGDPAARAAAEKAASLFEPVLGRLLLDVELKVQASGDGMIVQPVYVHYVSPLAGAPGKGRLPAEIHVVFSTAATDGASESGQAFAASRIQLPSIGVGDEWYADQLAATSGVLALRPHSGVIAGIEGNVGAKLRAHADKVAELDTLRAQLAYLTSVTDRAQPKPATSGRLGASGSLASEVGPQPAMVIVPQDRDRLVDLPPFVGDGVPDQTAVPDLRKRMAAIELEIVGLRTALNATPSLTPGLEEMKVRATTVDARLVLIKDENKFGMAIANALSTRATQAASAITTYVGQVWPAWTTADSDYFLALDTVRVAAADLSAAQVGGDKAAISAETSRLVTAKLDLNVKAVASHRAPPYLSPM